MGNVIRSAKTSVKVILELAVMIGGSKVDPIVSKIKNLYVPTKEFVKHPIASYINYLNNKDLKNPVFDPWEASDYCINCERNNYEGL